MPQKKLFVLQFLVSIPSTQLSHPKRIKRILINIVNRQLSGKNLFSDFNDHDLEHELHTEDPHSSQLKKKIIEKYTTLRLLTYGKHYNKDILHKDVIGVRQQVTKNVLFKGI